MIHAPLTDNPRLYLGEIFPTRIREVGIAIGAAAQWLFNFALSQITPHAITSIGWRTFLMFAILNYAIVVYAYFILKEVSFLFCPNDTSPPDWIE